MLRSPGVWMQPFEIILKHYDPASDLYRILITHVILVTRKALEIALDLSERNPRMEIDMEFIAEAGMLHDIGIKHCDAPEIFCHGKEPYIRHGILGGQMLEAEGLPRHALVCERHTGSGIARRDVQIQKLPLPAKDYLPLSVEEKIICVADKFYSKKPSKIWKQKSLKGIRKSLEKYGPAALGRWEELLEEVGPL